MPISRLVSTLHSFVNRRDVHSSAAEILSRDQLHRAARWIGMWMTMHATLHRLSVSLLSQSSDAPLTAAHAPLTAASEVTCLGDSKRVPQGHGGGAGLASSTEASVGSLVEKHAWVTKYNVRLHISHKAANT